jgi:hypothetical protein
VRVRKKVLKSHRNLIWCQVAENVFAQPSTALR